MCGFTDIRKSAEGRYYCPLCDFECQEDFREIVESTCGKKMARQLDKQCEEHDAKRVA